MFKESPNPQESPPKTPTSKSKSKSKSPSPALASTFRPLPQFLCHIQGLSLIELHGICILMQSL